MDPELEEFVIVSQPDSLRPETEFEGTNSCRMALAANLEPRYEGAAQTEPEPSPEDLASLGFDPELMFRFLGGERDEHESAELTYLDALPDWDATEVRYRAWNDLNDRGQLPARLAFLVSGLCSPLERKSVTAAVAILTSTSRARSDELLSFARSRPSSDILSLIGPGLYVEDTEFPTLWSADHWAETSSAWIRTAIGTSASSQLLGAIRLLANWRALAARRSEDPITREIAIALDLYTGNGRPPESATATDAGSNPDVGPAPVPVALGADRTSTMVHGTAAWKGDWWYPRGDFHTYIQMGFRNGLYGGGQEFSWSGAYRKKDRALGGERFARWAQAAAGDPGLGTVFGHSYGGEIVARAVNSGALVDEVVLLSAPIHQHHELMLDRVRRVIDIRLRFDVVLLAARARQKLPWRGNLVPFRVDRGMWSHGSTHHPALWEELGIAETVGL